MLLILRLQPNGFTNTELRPLIAELRGLPPDALTAGQLTYDLRRLRAHGFITRIPHSHRYHVTDTGLSTAHFLTAIHDRLLPTGLSHLATPAPPRTTQDRRPCLPMRHRHPHPNNRSRGLTTELDPTTF